MAWVLIEGALYRLRMRKQLGRKEAAKRTGLDEWTIHEHEEAPYGRTIRTATVEIYEQAYSCKREEFVTWSEPPLRARKQKLKPRIPRPAATPVVITTEVGALKVMGRDLLRECSARYAHHEGENYAVMGAITKYEHVPEHAALVLGATPGEGARFDFTRDEPSGPPMSITVFTCLAEHTQYLIDCAKSGAVVIVVVRFFLKPAGSPFDGFPIFRKKRSRVPFALIVAEIATPR